MTRWSKIALTLLSCGPALAGCSASTAPSPDSETHFLVHCENHCAAGLTCICGVCTAVCDPARDCSGQHDDASCVPVSAFADEDACAGEEHPVSLSVCELECSQDADCRALSDRHICDAQGRCRAPASGAGPAPGTCRFDGVTYRTGDTFRTADDCNGCRCNEGGVVTCDLRACQKTCNYDGNVYAPGATFTAVDGCNACECGEDGAVDCTTIACPPSATTCEYNGTIYAPGETFPAVGGCNTCECHDDGAVGCTLVRCPVMSDGGGSSCMVEGTLYEDGDDEVPDPFSCNTCQCVDGTLDVCTEAACDEPCAAGTKPGTSCAQCGPTDACEVRETGCLPTCATSDDCPPEYFFCLEDEGHCANVCG